MYSNYTLESSVFSVILDNSVIPDHIDSVVEFNITHRTVWYQLLNKMLLIVTAACSQEMVKPQCVHSITLAGKELVSLLILGLTRLVCYSDGSYKPFWSQAGCEQLNSTDTYTTCRCNHLTHFAVLFDARGATTEVIFLIRKRWAIFLFLLQISPAHETALKVITYVGVAVSLPCLLITVVCFLVLKYVVGLIVLS